MEESNAEKSEGVNPPTGWFASRSLAGLLLLIAAFVLTVQLYRVLSDSFRVELFGVEILNIERFAATPPPTALPLPEIIEPLAPPAAPAMVSSCTCLPLPPVPSYSAASEDREIFMVTEQMPELIGGLQGLQKQIRYPDIAQRAGIEGRVITQFVVDECGCVADPVVVRGIGGGCDEEALRVTQTLRFKPGQQRGKPVRVKVSLPITFRQKI